MRNIVMGMVAVMALQGGLVSTASGGQPLETESARLVKRGTFLIEGGMERQSSDAGSETAIPFAFEYGIRDRLELTVEPVFHTIIQDRGFRQQRGPGDIEVTLTTLLSHERRSWPAFAFAAEVKVPTARNTRIGTGKPDVDGTIIASHKLGVWDTSVNLGYTIIGPPEGAAVNNVGHFGISTGRRLQTRFDLVAEVFGSTPAAKEGAEGQVTTAQSQLTPELGGGELVGAMGLRFHPSDRITYSLGVSMDNNSAVLVHPGFAVHW